MFQSLFRLYDKQKVKRPLEDFNTECLAGILQMYKEVREDFIIRFLNLPQDKYKLDTQLKRGLEDTTDCIIDMVFEGESNICFIENKVHSTEGWTQLERYAKALDKHYPDHEKYLFYCTKFSDPKNQDGEFKGYHFKQFRWYEVANFLKAYKNNYPVINDYLHFLEQHGMAQDNTLRTENLLALQHLRKSKEIAEFHLNNAKSLFETYFGKIEKSSKAFTIEQVQSHNRFAFHISRLTESDGYSEILYSVDLAHLVFNVHIYLPQDHKQVDIFKNINLQNSNFKLAEHEWGSSIYRHLPLAHFLGDTEAESSILKWYEESFRELRDLLINNPQFKLNPQFESQLKKTL